MKSEKLKRNLEDVTKEFKQSLVELNEECSKAIHILELLMEERPELCQK